MEQRLRQVLASREVKRIRDERRSLSAVLLPLYYKQGQYHLLLTKRTEQLKEHRGQISFPGGVYEEQDGTLLKTALRECAEEIGLAEDEVGILGALDDAIPRTLNYIISPFVGVIPWPFELRVNTEEIDEIIEVPISALLDKGTLLRGTEIINGETIPAYFYHYQGKVIWGATARILNQFLGILTQIMIDDKLSTG